MRQRISIAGIRLSRVAQFWVIASFFSLSVGPHADAGETCPCSCGIGSTCMYGTPWPPEFCDDIPNGPCVCDTGVGVCSIVVAYVQYSPGPGMYLLGAETTPRPDGDCCQVTCEPGYCIAYEPRICQWVMMCQKNFQGPCGKQNPCSMMFNSYFHISQYWIVSEECCDDVE